jgi:hypothetical protein
LDLLLPAYNIDALGIVAEDARREIFLQFIGLI